MSLTTLMQRIGATSSSAGRLVGLIESELAKPLLVSNDMISEYARSLIQFGAPNREDISTKATSTNTITVRSSNSVTVTTYLDLNAAVLDISGPLTNREINGPCMASPVSYQAIRSEIDNVVADPRVDTVIARVDSGGGVASNMVDLADYIREVILANPNIRFIASIDDMAGSAAFGIVAAFPERYISRTGLAGSVGVVVRHTDNSVANAAKGQTHTYIFAGDNKVIGNSDEPLTDAGKALIKHRVGMHYDLFATSVASGLGMSVEAVKATEANVYQGQDAVDIGFATGIMTFTEIIQSLESKTMTTKTEQTTATTTTGETKQAPVAETTVDTNVQQTAETVNPVENATGDTTATTTVAQTSVAPTAEELARKASIEAVCSIGGVGAEQTAALIAGGLSADAVANLVANSTASGSNINNHVTESMQGETTSAEKEEALAQSWAKVLK